MNKVYIFRGKAATGKTKLTNKLSEILNIPVYRKDDVYDPISNYNLDHVSKNSMSYDVLAWMIQTNINNKCDLIIDISLYHNDYYKTFLDKLDLSSSRVYKFFNTCSNHDIWSRRMEDRILNPLPNQCFESLEVAINHYEKLETSLQENEIEIDSARNFEGLLSQVIDNIKDK